MYNIRYMLPLKGPDSLAIEHEELHRSLAAIIKKGGKNGKLAQAVADLLHPHFTLEEELAMPLLGLLEPIFRGGKIPEAGEAIILGEKLEQSMEKMLGEHRKIVTALNKLERLEPKFARKLKLHAQNEEEVLYPAAIMVGRYLRSLSHSKS